MTKEHASSPSVIASDTAGLPSDCAGLVESLEAFLDGKSGPALFKREREVIAEAIAALSRVTEAVAEPEAFLIERLEGTGYGPARKVLDARQYDPRDDDFWMPGAKERHRITPLCATPPAPQPALALIVRAGIYTASKTVHAEKWRKLRAEGWPIVSTWIDEAGVGETTCFTDLWRRCVSEAAGAEVVVLYREPGEVLKGAFIEAGAALARGTPVYTVGCEEFSFVNHELVTQFPDLATALASAKRFKGE